jgi:signal peptide peptidase SppA
MNHSLLIAEFLGTPWAMHTERFEAIASMLERWSSGAAAPLEVMTSVQIDKDARTARAAAAREQSGSIAVLPMYGAITQRGNMAAQLSGSGAMSTQKFSGDLRAALADPSISQILIDIDSPGGSVFGISELGDELMQARAQKPVIGFANSTAASAAYWLAACCSELYMTPGGEVGSIGVVMAHQDKSAAMEKDGIRTTYITTSKYKAEGNSSAPLSDETTQYLQARAGAYHAMFTKAVAKGRNVPIDAVRDGMGQGRMLGASDALSAGMVDGVMTFDQVVKKMQAASKPNRSALKSAQNRLSILG